jgi:hypothetical protein
MKNLLSTSAVSEYNFYGLTSKKQFKLSRYGIRFNSASEKNENFNKWMLIAQPGMGNGEILLNTGKWASIHIYRMDENKQDEKYFFETPEIAANMLKSIVDEELTTYSKTSLLSTMFEEGKFPKNLNSIIQKETDFIVWNEGEFSDLELEYTVSDESNDQSRISMNLHIIFYWEQNEITLDLGTNFGDGFNEGIKIEIDQNMKLSDQFHKAISTRCDLVNNYVKELKKNSDNLNIGNTIHDIGKQLNKLEMILY